MAAIEMILKVNKVIPTKLYEYLRRLKEVCFPSSNPSST
jgi:hypothetical protein